MASYVQPLLVLLASLFFLPVFRASRAVDFEYCNLKGYNLGNITRVEVSTIPDDTGYEPTITITVYGSSNNASKYINSGSVEVILSDYDLERLLINYNLCSLNACPIKPGTNFVLTIPEVNYNLNYALLHDHYNVTLFDDKRTIVMCVSFIAPSYEALTMVSA